MPGSKEGARTRDNLLTEEELAQLLAVVATEAERITLYTLAYTGMRVSEFIHMRRDWIKGEYIQIPPEQPCTAHSECRARGGVWRPKTPDSARYIPILPELAPVLKEFFKHHESIEEAVPRRETAWRIVRAVARRAGIKKRIFPHVFRGTLASILAGRGFDSLAIQAFLGWRTIKMADYYVRVSPSRLKRIIEERW